MTDTPLIDTPGLRELMQARPELFEWVDGTPTRVLYRGQWRQEWRHASEPTWRLQYLVSEYVAAAVIEKRLRDSLWEDGGRCRLPALITAVAATAAEGE